MIRRSPEETMGSSETLQKGVQASLQSHLGHYPWPERLPGQRVGLFPASGPLTAPCSLTGLITDARLFTGYVADACETEQQRMSNGEYTGEMSHLSVCEVKQSEYERQTTHFLPQSSEGEDSLIDSVSGHWYSDMTDSHPPTRTPAVTHKTQSTTH